MGTKEKITKVIIFIYGITLIVLGYLLLKLGYAYILIIVGLLCLIHATVGINTIISAFFDLLGVGYIPNKKPKTTESDNLKSQKKKRRH